MPRVRRSGRRETSGDALVPLSRVRPREDRGGANGARLELRDAAA